MDLQNRQIVSRLPWLPVKLSGKSIDQTEYFKEVMSKCNDGGTYNVEFYRLMNDSAPLFLSARFARHFNERTQRDAGRPHD
jgi:hypothetical protein